MSPKHARILGIRIPLWHRVAAPESDGQSPDVSDAKASVPDIDFHPVPLLWVSVDGTIRSGNERAHTVLGRAPGTLTGRDLSELGWDAPWPPTLGHERDDTAQSAYAHPDGSERALILTAGVKPDANGCRSVLLEDATARLTVAREREALHVRAHQNQRLQTVGTLAGGIAHDFNNLLAPILGYAEMAQAGVDSDDELYADLDHIRVAAHRARDLVAQMMRFSRPDSETLEPVFLHSLVREVTALLRASLPSTVRIVGEADRNAPPILGSPTQLHQILFNLCTNASHAMPDGGLIQVHHDTFSRLATLPPGSVPTGPGPYVRLRVTDDGAGMSPETLAQIFEPFFTTKAPGKGTGLGLSTVRSLVQELGGTLSVESEIGQGTTFSLLFPAHEEAVNSEASGTCWTAPEGEGQILLVDDEVGVLEVTRRSLTRLGYDVRAYSSSPQALDVFQQTPTDFDLILTDQTMPDLTGTQLARRARESRPDMPIVLTSGNPETENHPDLEELGRCRFLAKPASPDQLGRAIARSMQSA